MVVINGIVGNNTRRKLNIQEFRGFSLCDEYTPLIFVNGADAKSVQMFTRAHELAHIWLGQTGEGVSGFENILPDGTKVEAFCDKVAVEFLLPTQGLKIRWNHVERKQPLFRKLARQFKVSPTVVGRRTLDLGLVDRESYFVFYREYTREECSKPVGPETGGDFYNNKNT